MEAGPEAPGVDGTVLPRAAFLATQFATPLELADYLEDESDAGRNSCDVRRGGRALEVVVPWRCKKRRKALGITRPKPPCGNQGSVGRPVQLCTSSRGVRWGPE
eukprot:3808836-Amphidinium_carterae.1